MELVRIDHIGIRVRALDSALDAYRDKLEFQPAHEGTLSDAALRYAALPVGNDGHFLALIEPTKTGTALAKVLERRGEGINHVALAVSDVAATRAELEQRHTPTLDGPFGSFFVDPRALHGLLLGIIPTAGYPVAVKSSVAQQYRRINHFSVRVKNLDEAVERYRARLGVAIGAQEDVTTQAGSRRAIIYIGQAGQFLELIEPVSPTTAVGRALAQIGEGVHHIALGHDDPVGYKARLTAAGVRVVQGPSAHEVFLHPSETRGALLAAVAANEKYDVM